MRSITRIFLAAVFVAGCTMASARERKSPFQGTKLVWDTTQAEQYANIRQERIEYNFYSQALTFNGERIRLEELAQRLEGVHSISFTAYDLEGTGPTIKPALDILNIIAQSNVDKNLVTLDCNCMTHDTLRKDQQDNVAIAIDGSISLNGDAIKLSEIAKHLRPNRPVNISYASTIRPDFEPIVAVLAELDAQPISSIFFTSRSLQVKVEAEVFHLNDDGSQQILSAPTITTKPGRMSSCSVTANRSGYERFFLIEDRFHQKDLAHLGVQFSIGGQFVGEYTVIEGLIVLIKETDRTDAFTMGDIPIYGYSSTKIVAPFSVVQPLGVDYIELETAEIDGKKTYVRVKATPMDDRGNPLPKEKDPRNTNARSNRPKTTR